MNTTLSTDLLPHELRLFDPVQEIAAGSVWLRKYLETSGQDRYVLGLSGGLDSVTVAMWVRSAGLAGRLTMLALPYQAAPDALLDPSSADSLEDAQLVADLVPEAAFRVVNIQPAVDAILRSLGFADALRAGAADPDLRIAAANAKALVRATTLRTETRRARGLLHGTENQSEHYLGYFTIGGDEESDIELLSFFKTQVRQIAEHLGVPERILAKAPSADLWSGQTDERELGFTYAQADFVLSYAGETRTAAQTLERIRAGIASVPGRQFAPDWVERVTPLVLAQRDRTRYKRLPKPHFLPVNRTHV